MGQSVEVFTLNLNVSHTTIIRGVDEYIYLHEGPLRSHDHSPSFQVSMLQDVTDQTRSHLSHSLSLSKQILQLVYQIFTENGCLLTGTTKYGTSVGTRGCGTNVGTCGRGTSPTDKSQSRNSSPSKTYICTILLNINV